MSRKTPQQKKAESYEHDRRDDKGCPHGLRRNRPAIKAQEHRQERHSAREELIAELARTDAEDSENWSLLEPKHAGQKSWPTTSPLRKMVERHLRSRVQRESHNLFRKGYSPETHARFRRVLLNWMEAGPEQRHSQELAEFYHGLLNGFRGEVGIPKDWSLTGNRPAPFDYLGDALEWDKLKEDSPELAAEYSEWLREVTKAVQRADAVAPLQAKSQLQVRMRPHDMDFSAMGRIGRAFLREPRLAEWFLDWEVRYRKQFPRSRHVETVSLFGEPLQALTLAYYGGAAGPVERPYFYRGAWSGHREFLVRFFVAEPGLERLFRRWITRVMRHRSE